MAATLTPWSIVMDFEGLPPSVNDAYFTKVVKKGKKLVPLRILSAEGRAYHKRIKGEVVQRYGLQLQGVTRSKPYVFVLGISTPNLFNKGWPQKAEHPYKRLDGTNRFKILEDAIAEALAIDDSQFMQSTVIKRHAEVESTRVWIWENTDDHYRHPQAHESLGGLPAVQTSGHSLPPGGLP
jgi:Holliday junction resolvase RusA-like endonuclease